jgi:hypothetical protein
MEKQQFNDFACDALPYIAVDYMVGAQLEVLIPWCILRRKTILSF